MNKPITEKQQIILNTCVELQKENGRFPSIREIGDRLGGRSTNGTRITLNVLVKKGALIKVGENSFRSGWALPPENTEIEAIALLRRVISDKVEWNEAYNLQHDIHVFLKKLG